MKSIWLLLMVTMSLRLFGQQPDPVPEIDYLQKSTNQKTAAWILAGGGTILFIAGLAAYSNKVENTDNPFEVFDTSELLISIAGAAAIGGSILLFKAAARNKRKGAVMGLKLEKLPVIQQQSLVNKSFPAVSFSIGLSH